MGLGRLREGEALVPWRHELCADDVESPSSHDRHDGVGGFLVRVRQ